MKIKITNWGDDPELSDPRDWFRIKKLFHSISAERTALSSRYFPVFHQHRKAYFFTRKFIRDKKIIELGCGNGFNAFHLSQLAKKYIAVDNDVYTMKNNNNQYKRKNLDFVLADIENYSINFQVDVVITLQVLEHFENPQPLLKQIVSVLKTNGKLILSTPNSITQSYNENPYHYKEYSAEELINLLHPYFRKINLYGVYGNEKVEKYDNERRKKVMSLLSKDKFLLRRLIPRRIKQIIFDVASLLNKNSIKDIGLDINMNDFTIKKFTDSSAIDLIAVCTK